MQNSGDLSHPNTIIMDRGSLLCKNNNILEKELMKETLDKGKYLRFRALGVSMFPWVRSGDIVTIKPAGPEIIYRGDILFFETENDVILHRLIKKRIKEEDQIFVTKGDNLPSPDPPINSSQILGKLVSVERGNRIIRLDSAFQHYISQLIIFVSPLIYYFLRFSVKSVHIISKLKLIL